VLTNLVFPPLGRIPRSASCPCWSERLFPHAPDAEEPRTPESANGSWLSTDRQSETVPYRSRRRVRAYPLEVFEVRPRVSISQEVGESRVRRGGRSIPTLVPAIACQRVPPGSRCPSHIRLGAADEQQKWHAETQTEIGRDMPDLPDNAEVAGSITASPTHSSATGPCRAEEVLTQRLLSTQRDRFPIVRIE
jgi:hypothetical protein